MNRILRLRQSARFWIVVSLLATCLVYWPGLSGSWLFDDYPSIVENPGVHPSDLSVPSLVKAALSSTTSEFKRPLASLSFALNYRASGLDPYWMKLTNLFIHLLNGLLVYLLARALLRALDARVPMPLSYGTPVQARAGDRRSDLIAVVIAAGWMLLPINLTAVLYVVQRMESLANVFVLLGLLGYVAGRQRMLGDAPGQAIAPTAKHGFVLCAVSLTLPTAMGLLAKETAVMLPLYALLIEWVVFEGRRRLPAVDRSASATPPSAIPQQRDWRIGALFVMVLVLPMILGLAWLLPSILNPQAWVTRNFTLRTRLLSEARIVLDYLHWSLLPTTHELKFYYDDFIVSSGWLTPWTTLASVIGLIALAALAIRLRRRRPLVALGLTLFLGAQLLTGTIVPLELVYEHRNYFASFGLLLALVPLLTAPDSARFAANDTALSNAQNTKGALRPLPFASIRHVLLIALMTLWATQTALGAYTWGSPLRLARELAVRSPNSPRAQYALGRTYSAYSQYNATSPFTTLAYASLEKAASLPDSSILPEQALIYMNARMHIPAKQVWWDHLIAKLKRHPPTVQDKSALRALSICALEHRCDLPKDRLSEAYRTALAYPYPGAQLQARYGDYAWVILGDKALGEHMMAAAVRADPAEPDYRIALINMLIAQGRIADAKTALRQLESLNIEGRLDDTLRKFHQSPELR